MDFYTWFFLFFPFSNSLIHNGKNKNDIALIDDLLITQNELLHDGLPFNFECNFTAFNEEFFIAFRRNSDIHLNEHQYELEAFKNILNKHRNQKQDPNLNLYHSYDIDKFKISNKDIQSFIGLAFLLRNLNPYDDNNFKIHFQISYNQTSNQSYSSVVRPSNAANIYEIQRVNSTYNEIEIRHKTRSKRQLQKKQNFIIDCAIHVDYSLYKHEIDSLKPMSEDYAISNLFIKLVHMFYSTKAIYDTFNHPEFTIELRLIDFFIHNKDFIKEGAENQFALVNNYVKKHNEERNITLCHVFYIKHGSIATGAMSSALGFASLRTACIPGFYTSLIRYDSDYHQMLSALAHELGHNFGCDHDVSDYNLMYPLASNADDVKGLEIIAQCVREIADVFLSRAGKKRLLESSKDASMFPTIHGRILPGHIYSPTEQCRMMMGSRASPYSFIDENTCTTFICSVGSSYSEKGLMDGSPCGLNKECYRRKCVNNDEIYKIDKTKLANIFNEDYKKLLTSVCPRGISRYGSNNSDIEKQNFCDEINNRNLGKYIPCRKNDEYSMKCCEHCIKFNYTKCDSYFRDRDKPTVDCEDNLYCKLRKNAEKCNIATCLEAKSACFNGGTCVTNITALKARDSSTAFYCICKKGYFGPLCLGFDPCSSNPCKLNQNCRPIGDYGHYSCGMINEYYKSCSKIHRLYLYDLLISILSIFSFTYNIQLQMHLVYIIALIAYMIN